MTVVAYHHDRCTWVANVCRKPAVDHVWRESRPGLMLEDDVCPAHLIEARDRGYQTGQPPSGGLARMTGEQEAVP